ncbi:hypothetical protein O9X98_05590 [Agrobacterium salinitolerans]|nr:hypothetical protein [Agrobacterium salinitolerans]
MQDLKAVELRNQLLAELREFARAYDAIPEGHEVEYWYFEDSDDLQGHDFNREVVKPGENEKAPDGCLRIMCDCDFHEVANLPLRFADLSCQDIVSILWPDIQSPVFYPDHGDHWWAAIGDPEMEVPGQPFELWFHFREGGAINESMRFEVFATIDEALAREDRVTAYITEGTEALFEIKEWRDGERLAGELRPRMNVVYSKPRVPIAWPWMTSAEGQGGDAQGTPTL